jgi:drug/metabolite transporter superfamily protein YnfA
MTAGTAQIMKAASLAAIIGGFWLCGWLTKRQEIVREKERRIVREVRHLIDTCKKMDGSDISIHGKCLICSASPGNGQLLRGS